MEKDINREFEKAKLKRYYSSNSAAAGFYFGYDDRKSIVRNFGREGGGRHLGGAHRSQLGSAQFSITYYSFYFFILYIYK
jgi:hypothetical protein